MSGESDIRGLDLHIDGVSGAAGDMFLAAMIELGVPQTIIAEAIGALCDADGAPLGIEIRYRQVVRGGIAAGDVKITVNGEVAESALHWHGDDSKQSAAHSHAHRQYREIRAQVASAALAPPIIERALDIFDRLARAEAKLHGSSLEDVAFHELGALDALGDIVGAAAALEWLGPRQVSCAPVQMGSGEVKTAHGILPVPSPAALEVLREAEAVISTSSGSRELCTPTGAAILASAVTHWQGLGARTVVETGYGAGDLELVDRPNVLRATVSRAHKSPAAEIDSVVVLETNIDDLSAELCAHAAEVLATEGALDVWWTPITMKKGRPALALSVLCRESDAESMLRILWTETSTLGVRIQPTARRVLERSIETVATAFGSIEIKVGRLDGEVVNVAPEFDSCARASATHGAPAKDVYAATLAAFAAERSN